MITMPIVYGLWKLLSSTNARWLSQRVYAGGVECSVADSQSFARKLNREGVKLYGWQPALSGLVWKGTWPARCGDLKWSVTAVTIQSCGRQWRKCDNARFNFIATERLYGPLRNATAVWAFRLYAKESTPVDTGLVSQWADTWETVAFYRKNSIYHYFIANY